MHTMRRSLAACAAAAVTLVAATCKQSEAPLVATTITVTPGGFAIATIGHSVQLTATVFDQKGDTMKTATVTWSSDNTAAATVSAAGLVTGVANGTAHVKAASGAASGTANATVAQTGAQLTKASGDAQTGTAGAALANAIVVTVKDSGGQAAAGVPVAFTASAGTVLPASANTNAAGQAQTAWTLGNTAGANKDTLTVTAGTGSAVFTASVTAAAASAVVKLAGDFQKTQVGAATAVAPSVKVTDQFGNVVAGDSVTFAVASGGGSVTGGAQVSNASGIATVGSWTVGASPGVNTLNATAKGVSTPGTFTDTAYALGTPASVVVVAGTNNIPGLVGYKTNFRPAVVVKDAGSNPVSGITVTFAVTSGGGSGTGLVTTTNAQGIAQVGSWTLGASAGVNNMTATVTGLSGGGNPVTFADTGATAQYTIQLQYFGNYQPTAAESASFNLAVAKWQSIIYRHAGNPASISDTAGTCGAKEPAVNQTITDILIMASFDSIDGPGKILAQAGPCFLRTSNGLSVMGVMKFDTADVAGLITAGQLNEVVEHEMGHVLGFGTLWNMSSPFPTRTCLQLSSNPPGTINDTYFSCTAGGTQTAVAAFDSLGGTSYTGSSLSPPGSASHVPPVENCGASSPSGCGAGTVNSHWREPVFTNELMTGYINSGSNPLSYMTAASLADLGYTVNYAGTDTYTHTFTAPAVGGAAPVFMGDDLHHGPLYAVDAAGRIRLVKARQ